MATIEKRGASYNVRYRVEGKSRRKAFTRHQDALTFKAQVETEQATGRGIDPVSARTTFKAFYPLHVKSRVNVKQVTLTTSKTLYDNHVNRWDDWPLERITQAAVQDWIASMVLEARVSASTIRACYKEFSAAMKTAVAGRYIRETPCVGINLPTVDRDPMVVLDHAEIHQLAEAINPRFKALVLFLAYSGFRIGEASALRWSDVDLLKGTATVHNTVTEVVGKGLVLERPKTRAAHRTVPLPQHVTEALKEHQSRFGGQWVFTTSNGTQVNPRTFNRRAFATALTKAKLSCRVHDLRHTAISLWIRQGVDLPRIKAWAGHTDAAFTLNTYAKFFPTDDTGIMDMLNKNIANALEQSKNQEN
ncbi:MULTISPECIES: tyrosine-type recombinase/integrase [unclassified Nocardioides]|uniref:tyrosine-type recombinase/integrase n=1 Tax=unclassified Nocardioides TaxID=2615069 RepID=UPI0007036132|nr:MULTISPECIES: site-specific integrase [unclassified Nocardioides]KRC50306.1 hypothetical protein ASE19_17075 [Nocardioides sp. Root79]KRC75774.1 hypothetical protein ASE20_23095 [Nocardioides sp. Root240]